VVDRRRGTFPNSGRVRFKVIALNPEPDGKPFEAF
jgi:hypothetical protein